MGFSLNKAHHAYIALLDVRQTLYDHFPEYLSGSCLCGADVPTYQMWIDHVMSEMESTVEDSDGT